MVQRSSAFKYRPKPHDRKFLKGNDMYGLALGNNDQPRFQTDFSSFSIRQKYLRGLDYVVDELFFQRQHCLGPVRAIFGVFEDLLLIDVVLVIPWISCNEVMLFPFPRKLLGCCVLGWFAGFASREAPVQWRLLVLLCLWYVARLKMCRYILCISFCENPWLLNTLDSFLQSHAHRESMASTSLEEHGSRFIAICLSKVFKILAVLASTTTRHEKPSC